jgi:hypothetical protein
MIEELGNKKRIESKPLVSLLEKRHKKGIKKVNKRVQFNDE